MFSMTVEDVFFIRKAGLVAVGRVESGQVNVGDTIRINGGLTATVDDIQTFRKKLDQASTGDHVGLVFANLEKGQVEAGALLTHDGPPGTTVIV